MSISYAGVNLPLVTQEAAAWAEAHLRLRELEVFQIRHDRSQTQSRLSIPDREETLDMRLGVLQWPQGARKFAVGLYLCTDSQLASIKAQVYGVAGGEYNIGQLVLDDETQLPHHGVSVDLWLLPTYPILQIPGQGQMYLLILVDERYFWWGETISVNGNASYTTVWDALGAQLGVTLDVDTIATAFRQVGNAHTSTFEYPGPVLDSLAYGAGQRVVVDLDNSIHVYNPATATAILASDNTLGFSPLMGGVLALGSSTTNEMAGFIPTEVGVTFPNLDAGGQQSTLGGSYLTVSFPISNSTITSLTSGAFQNTIGNGNTKLWKSTGLTNFNETYWTASLYATTPLLEAYVVNFASQWLLWQLGPTEVTLAGICDWVPTGYEDRIEWVFHEGNVSTRLLRTQLQDLTEDLIHGALAPTGNTLVGSTNIPEASTQWTGIVLTSDSIPALSGTNPGTGHGFFCFTSGGSPPVISTSAASTLIQNVGTSTIAAGAYLPYVLDPVSWNPIVGPSAGINNSAWVTQDVNVDVTITVNPTKKLTLNGPIDYCTDSTITTKGTTVTTGPFEVCGYQFWCCADYTFTQSTVQDWALPSPKTVFVVTGYAVAGFTSLSSIIPANIFGVAGPEVIAFVNDSTIPFQLQDNGAFTTGKPIFLPQGFKPTLTLGQDDAAILWYDACDGDAWRVLSTTVVPHSGLVYGSNGNNSPQSITSATFTTMTNMTAALTAGIWQIWANGILKMSPGGAGGSLALRLKDQTNNLVLDNFNGVPQLVADFTPAGSVYSGSAALMSTPYTLTGNATIAVEGAANNSPISPFLDSGKIMWLKLG